MEQDIINDYNLRIHAANAEVNKYKKLINTYSFLRLGLIGVLVVSIYLANMQSNFTIIAVTLVILLLVFAWLVSKQSSFEDEKKYFENLVKVNENEINSILHHTNVYDNGTGFSNDKHFYSADLDIFGPSSLYQLINRAATSAGIVKLGEWLNGPTW